MPAMQITHCKGELRIEEPMSKHTSWRVGGPAQHYFIPADIDDLGYYLVNENHFENVFWLGLGSNLLVRDGGIRGSVIATANALSGIKLLENNIVEVASGVPCAILARFCARHNLVDGEFFAGIPGVIGGALAMNAGAFGGETWPLVMEVETIDSKGQRKWRKATDYQYAYRTVSGPENEWFVNCRMKFSSGDGESAAEKIKKLLAQRAATQPTGTANCGSVFRNPEGTHAAKLIEDAGLKGYKIGGAIVSEKHANFIINEGNASAADIENLIIHVQKVVYEKSAVTLKTEVKIVGDKI